MQDPRITHRGNAYGVGQGEDHYGVWDLRAGGDPVARYELTPKGWISAWERYRELEDRFGTSGWRSSGVGWILLHLLIGLILWFLVAVLAIGTLDALGRDIENPEDGTAFAFLGALLPAVAGWYLFVYLSASRWVRSLLLALGLLIAGGLVVIVGYVRQPPT